MNTSHIGSLPFLTVKEAIQFNQYFSLPCLPTLPKKSENEWMINQFLSGFLDHEHILPFECFNEFFKTYKGRVKVQVCGIQTLYNNLNKEVPVSKFIDWYLAVVNRFINRIENDFILFFDEPDLRITQTILWNVYHSFSGYELGIHSCAKNDWETINLNPFKHISFDSKFISPTEIEFLRSQNKVLYFGDIDTKTGEIISSRRTDIDYLTPSCGLALCEFNLDKIIDTLNS